MLKVGQVVTIWYDDMPAERFQSPNWQVLEYDNGLVKLQRGTETIIWNMRSVAFIKCEVTQR